jgi:hypothetical protein
LTSARYLTAPFVTKSRLDDCSGVASDENGDVSLDIRSPQAISKLESHPPTRHYLRIVASRRPTAQNAAFLVNTGDLVWWGRQGGKPSDNPYRALVNKEVLSQLPPPDDEMKKAGLDGRVFPAVGNHEVWEDSDVQGLLASFPYLTKLGVSDKQLIYRFDFIKLMA